MVNNICICVLLSGKAYAAEIQMGAGGMLVFEPCELTINVGDTVTLLITNCLHTMLSLQIMMNSHMEI